MISVNQNERDIQRKLRILKQAKDNVPSYFQLARLPLTVMLIKLFKDAELIRGRTNSLQLADEADAITLKLRLTWSDSGC